MKKLLVISILAAMLLSVCSCSKSKTDADKTTAETTKANTILITAGDEVPLPTSIAYSEIQTLIDSVKAEYATAYEMTLSDGTIVSAVVKDPALTVEMVTGGMATAEQMDAYVTYLANIRRIVCDRLMSYFPDENKFIPDEKLSKIEEFLFLDPISDGFFSAKAAFAKVSSTSGVATDYIIIQNSTAYYCNSETDEATIICPNNTENELLVAVLQNLDPGAVTTESATAITEITVVS